MMTSGGVPRLVVGKILNHVEKGVTATYDRSSYDTDKRVALDWWALRLKRCWRTSVARRLQLAAQVNPNLVDEPVSASGSCSGLGPKTSTLTEGALTYQRLTH